MVYELKNKHVLKPSFKEETPRMRSHKVDLFFLFVFFALTEIKSHVCELFRRALALVFSLRGSASPLDSPGDFDNSIILERSIPPTSVTLSSPEKLHISKAGSATFSRIC